MNKTSSASPVITGSDIEVVTLVEAAKLELAGSERRLAIAIQSLADFDAEFASKTVGDELACALAHERDALATELDAAIRRHNECAMQVAELKQER
jgi:hypothetical protein